MGCEQQAEEEALVDVPEDFLDPIMGELMRDPVVLPSSGKIVDRTTIARHILRCFLLHCCLIFITLLSFHCMSFYLLYEQYFDLEDASSILGHSTFIK